MTTIPLLPRRLKTKNKRLIAQAHSPWVRAVRTFVRHPLGMMGLIGTLVIVGGAFLAPHLAPYDPLAVSYRNPLAPPSADFWFGTDDLGRDIFSRILWGGRETLQTVFMAMLIAVSGGVIIGTISGYFGGYVDEIIQRLIEIVLAFPAILLLLSIIAILGPSLVTIMIAMGIATIPIFTRLVRSVVLVTKQREYVVSAQALGASHWHILRQHIIPNIIPTLIVYVTIDAAAAILVTSGLSYIGLGAQPPTPEWGAMLNEGRRFIYNGWWLSVFPGLFVMATSLCINFLGEGLRKALSPRRNL